MGFGFGFKYEFGALGIDGLNRNIVIKGEYGRDTKANAKAKTLKGAKPKRRHTDTVTDRDTEEVTIINSNANSTNQIESEKKHAKSSKARPPLQRTSSSLNVYSYSSYSLCNAHTAHGTATTYKY